MKISVFIYEYPYSISLFNNIHFHGNILTGSLLNDIHIHGWSDRRPLGASRLNQNYRFNKSRKANRNITVII